MDIVTSLMVKPGEYPCPVPLSMSRDFLQCAVSIGATFMGKASMFALAEDAMVIFNPEGVLVGLDGNRRIGDQIITGTFYIVGYEDSEFRSLTNEQIARYTKRFWVPEKYEFDDLVDSWMCGL